MVQPIAAVVTIASFFFDKGLLSASLSSAWLIVSAMVALFGLTRFIARGFYPLQESSVDAGLLYLPVAGVWLVVYRLGVQPFDYGETIILLTVIHFHFAGLCGADHCRDGWTECWPEPQIPPGRIFSGLIVLRSLPRCRSIAAGITFSPWLGLIGTLLLSAGLVMLAVLTLAQGVAGDRFLSARLLLLIAALSSCTAMVLACLYAYSIVAKILILQNPHNGHDARAAECVWLCDVQSLAWSIIRRKTFATDGTRWRRVVALPRQTKHCDGGKSARERRCRELRATRRRECA